MGLDAALRALGRPVLRDPQRHRPRRLGPGTRPGPRRALLARPTRRARPPAGATCSTRIGFDPDDDGVVLGMIGRMDPQKGFDLLADGAARPARRGARVIVQGSGHASLADPFRALAAANPDRVALIERFDRDMARRIYAGADLFLMPSRFEPCGQGQMIALRYGTPPVVRRTGGLADSVIDVTEHPAAGHRVRVRRGDARGAGRRGPAGRGAARGPGRVGRPPRPGHGRRLQLGHGLRAALPRGLPPGHRAPPRLSRPHAAGPSSSRAGCDRPAVRESRPRPRPTRGSRRPEAPMPRQFVVQVTNQPGQMARLAEQMAAAGVDLRAIGGGGLGRGRPLHHDHGRRRRGPARSSRLAAGPSSRASRCWPRWTTGRAAWRGSRASCPTPASTSWATCSWAAGATARRSRSSSTTRTRRARSSSAASRTAGPDGTLACAGAPPAALPARAAVTAHRRNRRDLRAGVIRPSWGILGPAPPDSAPGPGACPCAARHAAPPCSWPSSSASRRRPRPSIASSGASGTGGSEWDGPHHGVHGRHRADRLRAQGHAQGLHLPGGGPQRPLRQPRVRGRPARPVKASSTRHVNAQRGLTVSDDVHDLEGELEPPAGDPVRVRRLDPLRQPQLRDRDARVRMPAQGV